MRGPERGCNYYHIPENAWFAHNSFENMVFFVTDEGIVVHDPKRCAPSLLRSRQRPCGGHGRCVDPARCIFTDAVGAFQNCNLTGHPEGSAKLGVAILGDTALAAKHAGLDRREVHAAELQDLTMMSEPAQVAGLCQNSQGVDRADPWDGCQKLVVGVIGQKLDGPCFEHAALSNQTAPSGKHEAEHADGVGIWVKGQPHRASRRGVND